MQVKMNSSGSKFKLILFLVGLIVMIVAFLIIRNNIVSSPQKTWKMLLNAMRNSDVQTIEKLTTQEGLDDLRSGEEESKYLSDWQRWGGSWSEMDIRWEKIDDNTIVARLGNEFKEQGFVFTNELDGWKLAAWLRGH